MTWYGPPTGIWAVDRRSVRACQPSLEAVASLQPPHRGIEPEGECSRYTIAIIGSYL